MQDFLSEANSLFRYTQSHRRDFHKHPELGFNEFRTSGIVAKELTSLGLEVTTGVGGTGVVALIGGTKPGPVVLVRADMDALPIQEETGVEYSSENIGVMHACGHDAHTAILLTVAKMLVAHQNEINGTIKLVFQPAEEGMGGAERMMAEGILDNPKPEISLALHVWNDQPVGWIGISNGPSMAGAEIFNISITGKGGHGAQPNLAIDPVLASSHIISSLQGIVSRNVPPLKTAVVSVCSIHGGTAFNIIPSSVQLSGTIRTFEEEVRNTVITNFKKIVTSTAEAMGCRADIDLQRLTPPTTNDPAIAEKVQKVARQLLPHSRVETSNYQTMGSEDFAFILEKIPGCFIFVGSANPSKGLDAPHHNPKFDIDENALPVSVALMTTAIFEMLS